MAERQDKDTSNLYTEAEDARGKTHSWFQNEKVLIDLTVDHFRAKGIIVKEITEVNRKHFGYRITTLHAITNDTLARTLNIDLINCLQPDQNSINK